MFRYAIFVTVNLWVYSGQNGIHYGQIVTVRSTYFTPCSTRIFVAHFHHTTILMVHILSWNKFGYCVNIPSRGTGAQWIVILQGSPLWAGFVDDAYTPANEMFIGTTWWCQYEAWWICVTNPKTINRSDVYIVISFPVMCIPLVQYWWAFISCVVSRLMCIPLWCVIVYPLWCVIVYPPVMCNCVSPFYVFIPCDVYPPVTCYLSSDM